VGTTNELLLTGYTTTAPLGNAVLSFDRHPDAAVAVRANRELLPAAIEEVLRYRPPLLWVNRVTTIAGSRQSRILAGQE
jgi:cytochrome P450